MEGEEKDESVTSEGGGREGSEVLHFELVQFSHNGYSYSAQCCAPVVSRFVAGFDR